MPRERFAKGIERTGADIAEDDPDRADGELQQSVMPMAAMSAIMRSRQPGGGAIGHECRDRPGMVGG